MEAVSYEVVGKGQMEQEVFADTDTASFMILIKIHKIIS